MKRAFAEQFRSQGYLKALEGPIAVDVDIRHQIPASWPKKRKIAVLEGSENFVITKPDVDNIVKFYFDVLNKIAYDDDCQIVQLTSQMRYSNEAGVIITLFPVEDEGFLEKIRGVFQKYINPFGGYNEQQ